MLDLFDFIVYDINISIVCITSFVRRTHTVLVDHKSRPAPEAEPGTPEHTTSLVRRVIDKLGRKGVTLVTASTVVVVGAIAGAVTAFGPRGGEGTEPNPDVPVATGPAVPGEVTPEPTATPVETISAEQDVLSPESLWNMTPKERLEAIKIGKEYLDDPEAYIPQYEKMLSAIFNIGNSDANYNDWDANYSEEYVRYGDYLLRKIYNPMLAQLGGHKVSEMSTSETSLQGSVARLVGTAALGRDLELTSMELFTVNCTASNVEVSKAEDGGVTIHFDQTCDTPTAENFFDRLPNLYDESGNKYLKGIFNTLKTEQTDNPIVIYNLECSEEHGVQPVSIVDMIESAKGGNK